MTAGGQAPPPLAGGGVDRVAHRRRDAGWLPGAWSRARVVLVDGERTLVHAAPPDGGPARLVLFDPVGVPPGAERYLLGVDEDGTPYFSVAVDPATLDELATGTAGEATPGSLRTAGEALSRREGSLLVTAVALAQWHRRHGYSPNSGRPTTAGDAGWTRVTEDGTETVFPRTDPAVIVLVHDGVPGESGRCLLASNAGWPRIDGLPRYSCLAGFVEPGESAEATVLREVCEEVGVPLRDVRYVASQPWPFPGSLMLGFTALADPDIEIRPADGEISDARWFTRAEITAVLAGQPAGFRLPFGVSIARYLIRRWAEDLA